MAIYLAPDDVVWERKLTEEELHARIAKLAKWGGRSRGRDLSETVPGRDALRSSDLDAYGFKPSPTLDHASRTQGRAGQGAGVALFFRLGDAGVRGPAQGLPCPRRAICVRDHRCGRLD